MRLVGYVRVSTEEQVQGHGLAMQRAAIQAYCQAHGHSLTRIYEDPGLSGTIMDRPALQAMLSNLDDVDGVIVYSVCRLSRNRIHAQVIAEEMILAKGKTLISTTQALNLESEEGRLLLAILAGMDQLERVKIVKRTSDGRKAKSRAGGYAGGRPAFGLKKHWQTDEVGKIVEKKLVIDADEAQVVDLIRRLRRSGKTPYAIAQTLNERGLSTKTGKCWRPMQVTRVLERLSRKA